MPITASTRITGSATAADEEKQEPRGFRPGRGESGRLLRIHAIKKKEISTYDRLQANV